MPYTRVSGLTMDHYSVNKIHQFLCAKCITRTCMNKAMYNTNIYIGYELAFYRYTFDLNIYNSMNSTYDVQISQ